MDSQNRKKNSKLASSNSDVRLDKGSIGNTFTSLPRSLNHSPTLLDHNGHGDDDDDHHHGGDDALLAKADRVDVQH